MEPPQETVDWLNNNMEEASLLASEALLKEYARVLALLYRSTIHQIGFPNTIKPIHPDSFVLHGYNDNGQVSKLYISPFMLYLDERAVQKDENDSSIPMETIDRIVQATMNMYRKFVKLHKAEPAFEPTHFHLSLENMKGERFSFGFNDPASCEQDYQFDQVWLDLEDEEDL